MKIKFFTVIILIFSIFYCILMENLSLFTILSGVIISLIVVLGSNHFIEKIDKDFYTISLIRLFFSYFFLIYNILYSAIISLKNILVGNTNTSTVKIETNIKNKVYLSILCNYITMTPGTLTLEKRESEITILILDKGKKSIKNLEEFINDFKKIMRIEI